MLLTACIVFVVISAIFYGLGVQAGSSFTTTRAIVIHGVIIAAVMASVVYIGGKLSGL